MINVIGLPLENMDSRYQALKITGFFYVSVLPSEDNFQRILYYWNAGRDTEEWAENRIQADREAHYTVALKLDGLSQGGKSSVFRMDLSQALTPLLDALTRQIVYFDNNWKPINPR